MKRTVVRLWLGIIATGLALVLAYFLAAWVGSSIPRNAKWTEPEAGVRIMVETNGVHTGIVVPIVSEEKDWRDEFPSAKLRTASGQLPTHIAIGFGEKEVFLEVGQWADLAPSTALRVVFAGGEGVVRVSHYVRPKASNSHRPLTISTEQYRALVSAIKRELPPSGGTERDIFRGNYSNDAYYEAVSDYTIINTCNAWVGERLAEAGLRIGGWTPLAGGVMKWITDPMEG